MPENPLTTDHDRSYVWNGRIWHRSGRHKATPDLQRERTMQSLKEVRAAINKRGIDNLSPHEMAHLARKLETTGKQLGRLAERLSS